MNKALEREQAGPRATRIVLGDDCTLALALLAYITIVQLVYFTLRQNGIWLYFCGYIEFIPRQWPVVAAASYLCILPLTYVFCRRAESDLFALILFPVVMIGGVSGFVVLLYAADYKMVALFFLYFIALPVALSNVRVPALEYPRFRVGQGGEGVFVLVGLVSLVVYLSLAWKYRSMIGLPGLDDIYTYRLALNSALEPWERYAMIFSKFVGGFSLGYAAISARKPRYAILAIVIFATDYMLAGHRASVGFAIVVVGAYIWFVWLRQRLTMGHLVMGLAGVSAAMGASFLIFDRVSPYAIGIYDRAFHVTVGLFARYVDHAESVGLYHGGDGLLGKIFGGNGHNYRTDIGTRFFGPNVSANADLVSDAYINFGLFGPLVAFLILRLLISRRDAEFFQRNREAVSLLMVPYALALFSMGLQTALITGALAFALILMKVADVSATQAHFGRMRLN